MSNRYEQDYDDQEQGRWNRGENERYTGRDYGRGGHDGERSGWSSGNQESGRRQFNQGRGNEWEYGRGYGERGQSERGFDESRWGGGEYGGRSDERGYGQQGYGPSGRAGQGYGMSGQGSTWSGQQDWNRGETWRGQQGWNQGSNLGSQQGASGSRMGTGSTYGPYTGMSTGRYTGKGPKGYQRSDDRVREDVCELLTQHGEIDASDVDVKVSGGEVTLAGMVQDRRTKRMVEEALDRVSGVKDVHNQLKVKERNETGWGAGTSGSQSSGTQTTGTSSTDISKQRIR